MWSFLAAAALSATPAQRNLTAEYIATLRPKMRAAEVVSLANSINVCAESRKLDPMVMVAIIEKESGFRKGLKACWPHAKKPGVITCDRGLAQVNELWIRKWKLDEDRLQNDSTYNVCVQARILAAIKKESGSTDPNWVGRYHSKTPSKKLRYMNKISAILAKAPSPTPEPQEELLALLFRPLDAILSVRGPTCYFPRECSIASPTPTTISI